MFQNNKARQNLTRFVFLKHPFWDSPFCLILTTFYIIHSDVIMNFHKKRKIRILAYVTCSTVASVVTGMICTATVIFTLIRVTVIYVYTAISSSPSRMTVARIATIVVVAFPIFTNICVTEAFINIYITTVPFPSTVASVIKENWKLSILARHISNSQPEFYLFSLRCLQSGGREKFIRFSNISQCSDPYYNPLSLQPFNKIWISPSLLLKQLIWILCKKWCWT